MSECLNMQNRMSIVRNMDRIRKPRVILLSFLFFYIMFRPPLISLDPTYVVLAVDLVILAFFVLVNDCMHLPRVSAKWMKNFVPFMIVYTFLEISHMVLESDNLSVYLNSYMTAWKVILYIVLTTAAIVALKDLLGLSLKECIYVVIITMSIQLIFVIAAFFSASVKEFFLEFLYKNCKNADIIEATRKESRFRCYGLAENLFDSLGYISALAITVIFAYGIRFKDRLATILSMVFLIIPLLNARTGLLLALVGMAIVFIISYSTKMIVLLPVVCVASAGVMVIVFRSLPASIQYWINAGISATKALFAGEKTGVYEEILKADFVWPSNVFWGAGASPENLGAYFGIDSGIVQCIWRYGIVGSILLFVGYVRMLWSGKNKLFKTFFLPLLVVFFLYLIKLFGITNFGSVTILFAFPILLKEYSDSIIKGKKEVVSDDR